MPITIDTSTEFRTPGQEGLNLFYFGTTPVKVEPNETASVPVNIAVTNSNESYFVSVLPVTTKDGLVSIGAIGTDADGGLLIGMNNPTHKSAFIQPRELVGELILVPAVEQTQPTTPTGNIAIS